MMNRFHWSLVALGVIAFIWWSFFAGVKDALQLANLYPEQDFLEDVSKIYCDLGSAAFKRGDFGKAIHSYQEATAMRPTWLEGYDRLGTAYELNNQPEEALKVYAHAMAINPDFFDYRTHAQAKQSVRTITATPRRSIEWTGQSLTEKKIFVYTEKGFAETLIFCRFLPQLKEKAAKVYFKPQAPLFKLIRQAKLGVTLCDNQTNLLDLDVDYHTSILSLLHYLAPTFEQLNAHKPYLHTNQEQVTLFHKTILNGHHYKIGIAWQPPIIRPGMKNRGVPLNFFTSLCDIANTKIYLLQKSAALDATSKFVNISDAIKNITDLAAVIENLDLVITADTTFASLAGALGKQTWFLTPQNADWIWLNHWDKTNSIWFDNFTKIQGSPDKNWLPVFELMVQKLIPMTQTR